jgi:prenyltransferase beta subunit
MRNITIMMIKGILLLFIFFKQLSPVIAQPNWKARLLNYINTKLAKKDGGYGWEDQPDSHITPTYAVLGILNDMDQLPADKKSLVEFVRTHHPQRGPNKETGPSASQLRSLVYQQIQSILWLDGDVSAFAEEVKNWKSQKGNTGNYETHGYAPLNQEVMTPICRRLLNLPFGDITNEFVTYLQAAQRNNGSFNSAPAVDGGDGNILNTYWSVYALKSLGKDKQLKKESVSWIQACQLKEGGFAHQPKPEIGVNAEVAYTWAAIKALQFFSAKPQNVATCIKYLLSLRNVDGGFGNRPGLPSNPISTYYALDALKALDAFSSLSSAPPVKQAVAKKPTDFSGYKVYTVQFEASGTGSPAEAVMLADSLKINLWGAKNPAPGWITAAQKIADKNKVPVTFFIADEPYGKDVSIAGMGSFGHILDFIAPANANIKFKDSASWQDFTKTTLKDLHAANGGLILQISNNEPLTRMLLDESVNNGGYLAISTVHFGQNFSFAQPHLHQYRYQLPFITLQDAHGTESWWWAKELVNHRTLFLAKEPTYNALITALKNNWVVAVRHDSISNNQTRMLGGTEETRRFISSKQNSWKWWKNETQETNHPWAAVTVLFPSDTFDVSRPEKGVNIRIRCRWAGARQVLAKPQVELQELKFDGKIVKPELITKKAKNGDVADSYHLYELQEIAAGHHIVETKLRNLDDKTVRTMTTKFTVPNNIAMALLSRMTTTQQCNHPYYP